MKKLTSTCVSLTDLCTVHPLEPFSLLITGYVFCSCKIPYNICAQGCNSSRCCSPISLNCGHQSLISQGKGQSKGTCAQYWLTMPTVSLFSIAAVAHFLCLPSHSYPRKSRPQNLSVCAVLIWTLLWIIRSSECLRRKFSQHDTARKCLAQRSTCTSSFVTQVHKKCTILPFGVTESTVCHIHCSPQSTAL